jgi:pimeloyl-ACP methyl ester carboxylesterase
MNKDLLIFPGGGSPENSLYHKVYDLLQTEAKNAGYERVSVLSWPGHSDYKNEFSSDLSMSGAMEVALARIREQEESSRAFDILARSFGTMVALACVKESAPCGLGKLILWGPPPFWLMWELFEKDLHANASKNLSKGLCVSPEFFSGLTPVEYLLRDINVETTVATGQLDPYSTPEFHGYLETMHGTQAHIRFPGPVVGCGHEVTADNPHKKEYIDALFAH